LPATVDFEVGTTSLEAWGTVTVVSKSAACSVEAGARDGAFARGADECCVVGAGIAGTESAAAGGVFGAGAAQLGFAVSAVTGAAGGFGVEVSCASANGSTPSWRLSFTATSVLAGCAAVDAGGIWTISAG
jgi:hypothetical protein